MKNLTAIIIMIISLNGSAIAQKQDKKLQQLLEKEVEGFRGDVGIYVVNLKKNTFASIAGDTIYPTASIIKVPLLAGVFQKISLGERKLADKFNYSTKQLYGGSGLMQYYKDSAETDLSTMVSLMLTYSDNVASIWSQKLGGGGTSINTLMDEIGLPNTKVNSSTEGREALWRKYGWGQTTPREIVKLMVMIREGRLFSPQLSDKMYRYLKNQFYNERALSQIPAHIATASKTGSVDDARGEVVVVHAPSGDYAFSILTKNNMDQSWTASNEAEELTRKISSLLWNYFEPKQKFDAFNHIP